MRHFTGAQAILLAPPRIVDNLAPLCTHSLTDKVVICSHTLQQTEQFLRLRPYWRNNWHCTCERDVVRLLVTFVLM
eukprot:5899425-Amphidinium_carterae.1